MWPSATSAAGPQVAESEEEESSPLTLHPRVEWGWISDSERGIEVFLNWHLQAVTTKGMRPCQRNCNRNNNLFFLSSVPVWLLSSYVTVSTCRGICHLVQLMQGGCYYIWCHGCTAQIQPNFSPAAEGGGTNTLFSVLSVLYFSLTLSDDWLLSLPTFAHTYP